MLTITTTRPDPSVPFYHEVLSEETKTAMAAFNLANPNLSYTLVPDGLSSTSQTTLTEEEGIAWNEAFNAAFPTYLTDMAEYNLRVGIINTVG